MDKHKLIQKFNKRPVLCLGQVLDGRLSPKLHTLLADFDLKKCTFNKNVPSFLTGNETINCAKGVINFKKLFLIYILFLKKSHIIKLQPS